MVSTCGHDASIKPCKIAKISGVGFKQKCQSLPADIYNSLYKECLKVGLNSFGNISALCKGRQTGSYALVSATNEGSFNDIISYITTKLRNIQDADVDVLMVVSAVIAKSFEMDIDPMVMVETLKEVSSHVSHCFMKYVKKSRSTK